MAITQISQIQVRRGLNQDLPQLATGELAWSTDTQQLYIGNGSIGAPDYAPLPGLTEILTQYSILNFTNELTANVLILQGNVVSLQNQITTLQNQNGYSYSASLTSTTNQVVGITANNAIMNYSLSQGSSQRNGTIRVDRTPGTSTVGYDEEYNQNGSTNVIFKITGNTTHSTIWANTVSSTGTLVYRITSL
jgi:Major tropism determinant N-terminal domain